MFTIFFVLRILLQIELIILIIGILTEIIIWLWKGPHFKKFHSFLPIFVRNWIMTPSAFAVCIISIVFFIQKDKEGSYCGLKSLSHAPSLPFNIKPKFRNQSPQSFYFLDHNNTTLLDISHQNYKNAFDINHFISYGYNDTSGIIKYVNQSGDIEYLMLSQNINRNIDFIKLNTNYIDTVITKYNWIDVDGKTIHKIKNIKIFFCFMFCLSLCYFLVLLSIFIYKRHLNNNNNDFIVE